MTTVYCDEAGNSGANLLDPIQPCFVLASNDFSTEEAESLIQHVRSTQGAEPKFTSLKKSGNGIEKLIRFLSDPRLNKERVLVSVFYKKFMVTTKLVDLIAETLIHAIGQDLYKQGENIAMSNTLHYCMPVFCGQENTNRFLHTFVELIRKHGKYQINAFYEAGRKMIEECTDSKLKGMLSLFTEKKLFNQWFGDHIDSLSLDPAIPALFSHMATWGARKTDRFHVVHDDSKPILASQTTFESMLAITGEESHLIGYDRRKVRFPLRALSLSQASSTEHSQLQVADICAGAINHYNRCLITKEFDDLAQAINDLKCGEWVFDGVIPSLDTTPTALGTDTEDGVNPIDFITNYLQKHQSHKN